MSGEGGDLEGTGGGSSAVRYSHKVHLLGNKEIGGDTTYLVRLRRESDYSYSFFLKKATDFVELAEKLKKDSANRMWGEVSDIQIIPEMPQTGRFGFRKALSKLGMSDFLDTQGEQIQKAMDQLMCQVTNMGKDATLTEFFTESSDSEVRRILYEWVLSLRAPVYLLAIMGFWRLAGSKRTWTIHSDGAAHLDGRHRGDQYDFHEEGDPASLQRVISRKDGWSIDLERSNKDKLIWVSPGKLELDWQRVTKDEAEVCLRKAEDLKAAMKKKKEEQQLQEQEAEKQKIRATILQRAATARLEKANTLNRMTTSQLKELEADSDEEPGKSVAKGPSTVKEGDEEDDAPAKADAPAAAESAAEGAAAEAPEARKEDKEAAAAED